MNIAEQIYLQTIAYSVDSIGQRTETVSETAVLAKVESVGMTEFFEAGQQGLKPDLKFTVWLTEYEGQENLRYGSNVYSVYRTYRRKDGRVELYTQKRVGDIPYVPPTPPTPPVVTT